MRMRSRPERSLPYFSLARVTQQTRRLRFEIGFARRSFRKMATPETPAKVERAKRFSGTLSWGLLEWSRIGGGQDRNFDQGIGPRRWRKAALKVLQAQLS